MWIFQAPYNALKRWKWRWFCDFMEIIQNQILWPALKAIGEAGKDYVLWSIGEARNRGLKDREAFQFVFDNLRNRYTVATISDDFLSNVIQNLYSANKSVLED